MYTKENCQNNYLNLLPADYATMIQCSFLYYKILKYLRGDSMGGDAGFIPRSVQMMMRALQKLIQPYRDHYYF